MSVRRYLPVFEGPNPLIKSGIYQTSHIYNVSDVESILRGCESLWYPPHPTYFSLLSATKGMPYGANTVGEIYAAVVFDIIMRPSDFGKMTSGVLDSLSVSTHYQFLQLLKCDSTKSLSVAIESSLPALALTHKDLSKWLTQEDHPASRKD
ncbi:Non-reducing polyketide synthase nscA-like protein [Cladobotryum mycophilum]|uniref:Non-reducing polyketide synthase nscA-like protein n=1 Tax=Cladobotryum mycophilum TaxID=491253 RepID=A0ABR0SXA2_9HYPO